MDIQADISSLESKSLCEIIYRSNLTKLETCQQVFNEIMTTGLTNTIYMIFNYA